MQSIGPFENINFVEMQAPVHLCTHSLHWQGFLFVPFCRKLETGVMSSLAMRGTVLVFMKPFINDFFHNLKWKESCC